MGSQGHPAQKIRGIEWRALGDDFRILVLMQVLELPTSESVWI